MATVGGDKKLHSRGNIGTSEFIEMTPTLASLKVGTMYRMRSGLAIFQFNYKDGHFSNSGKGNKWLGHLDPHDTFMLIEVTETYQGRGDLINLKILDAVHNLCGWTNSIPACELYLYFTELEDEEIEEL